MAACKAAGDSRSVRRCSNASSRELGVAAGGVTGRRGFSAASSQPAQPMTKKRATDEQRMMELAQAGHTLESGVNEGQLNGQG